MHRSEVSAILESNEKPQKKLQLLLTQIGYLRINLFGKYYEQIQLSQKNNELERAVSMMNNYAETLAIPFISTEEPIETRRFSQFLSHTNPLTSNSEQIRKWKNTHEEWLRQNQNVTEHSIAEKRLAQFEELKREFIALYTISFSVDDFPPLRNRRSDR